MLHALALLITLLTRGAAALAQPWHRRRIVATGVGALGAEAVGHLAEISTAAYASIDDASIDAADSLLPPGTIDQIESGRVVVIRGWLPKDQLAALHADAERSFAAGHFKADALATYGKKTKAGTNAGFDPANDRMVMPSFFPSKGTDGPWVDPNIGDAQARARFKRRMSEVRTLLARQMHDRPTLVADDAQTHEMSYSRYGAGASLPRHTDEHHSELKKASQPSLTRRSVTWLVYLNRDWDARRDGGELRVHERAELPATRVGARGADLQIGWLRATSQQSEQPVFLDARRGGDANCCLFVLLADGTTRRDLSAKPFAASPALYLSGGDFFARKLLIDAPADAERFHLIDAPKSAVSAFLPPVGDAGEDGGERVRDISPEGGTLVLFDSVSVPHEVLATVGRERYACSGWFHEKLIEA